MSSRLSLKFSFLLEFLWLFIEKIFLIIYIFYCFLAKHFPGSYDCLSEVWQSSFLGVSDLLAHNKLAAIKNNGNTGCP